MARALSGALRWRVLPVFASLSVQAVRAESPWLADFEAPLYQPGSIDGQHHWTVDQGTAEIIPGAGRNGSAGLVVGPSDPFPQASLRLEPPPFPADESFLDFYVLPAAALEKSRDEMVDVDGARIGLFVSESNDAEAFLWIFDGHGADGGEWLRTSAAVPVDPASRQALQWLRLTLREDFLDQSWDLWVDGEPVALQAGFQKEPIPHTGSYIVMGETKQPLTVDDLTFSSVNPLLRLLPRNRKSRSTNRHKPENHRPRCLRMIFPRTPTATACATATSWHWARIRKNRTFWRITCRLPAPRSFPARPCP